MDFRKLAIELIDEYERKYLSNGKAWEYVYRFMKVKLNSGVMETDPKEK